VKVLMKKTCLAKQICNSLRLCCSTNHSTTICHVFGRAKTCSISPSTHPCYSSSAHPHSPLRVYVFSCHPLPCRRCNHKCNHNSQTSSSMRTSISLHCNLVSLELRVSNEVQLQNALLFTLRKGIRSVFPAPKQIVVTWEEGELVTRGRAVFSQDVAAHLGREGVELVQASLESGLRPEAHLVGR
jgi:hypothetical protein